MSEGLFDINEFAIPIEQIALSSEMIYQRLGYEQDEIPDHLHPLVNKAMELVYDLPDVRAGFRILPPGSVRMERGMINHDGLEMHTGPIIGRGLADAESIAVFVATAGSMITRMIQTSFTSNEIMEGYILDVVGSEITERAVDWVEEQMSQLVSSEGWRLSNRYSPGYCEWDVAEQHTLFSLLPKNFCGVGLTESALMVPVKSASGIIGVGVNARKREYECSLCDKDECVLRHPLTPSPSPDSGEGS